MQVFWEVISSYLGVNHPWQDMQLLSDVHPSHFGLHSIHTYIYIYILYYTFAFILLCQIFVHTTFIYETATQNVKEIILACNTVVYFRSIASRADLITEETRQELN